ncbi:YgeY family selenium metabolism-linked hydrolase [Myxococcota bacterium]|nr:YgeY family selenium metabolism-linked hydrolase [Myxococcota bacterium]MBU1380214.1 YgeY family selenium metabolism-linked hydrolase [Myxococcota bacterium]MBU1498392.1 YgeY family selenium metabolism-linked hydrolase [Myxococcota bacterium]
MSYTEINSKAAGYLHDCKEFLKDIISIKSVSCQEKEVVERIAEEMKKVGFDEVKIDGLGNILGRVGTGPVQIAFDAHIDTVDVGDPELWEIDPFKPVEKDGIIYGRGASDQKAGMAGMVYAAKMIKELGIDEGCSVWMVGSVMEEDCDGLCWQYIIKEKVLNPEVVVLTEPTNLNLYRGHRGRMEIEVETKGISCHGSDPTRGDNAVYKMAPIINDIDKLNNRLKPTQFLGKGTVTISHIRSTSPSLCAVADSCTIHLDRRLTEGENEEVAVSQLAELDSVKNVNARIRVLDYAEKAYTGLVYPTKKFYPTWNLAEDHKAVQAGVKAGDAVLGRKIVVDKWVFSTNGIATAGMFNIPTIGFGPANEIHAHSPKDQCPVEHLEKAMAFYTGFVMEYMKAR